MSRARPLFDLTTMQRYALPGHCLESRPYGDRGTIGIIGVDGWTGRKVALTAMHVVPGITEYPSPAHPDVIEFESPCVNGTGSILGRLLRGTLSGVDAAVLDVEGQPVSNFLNGVGMVEFWRSVDPERDKDRPVRMVGAASGGVQFGRVIKAGFSVPDWGLASAILVEMVAFRGDSGAPLIDENGHLVGMLVGGNTTRQLFCPVELVFHRLTCQLFRG